MKRRAKPSSTIDGKAPRRSKASWCYQWDPDPYCCYDGAGSSRLRNSACIAKTQRSPARSALESQRTVNAGAPTGTVIPKGAKRGVLLSAPLKNRGLRNPLGIPALSIVYSRASIEKACSQFTRCTGATVSPVTVAMLIAVLSRNSHSANALAREFCGRQQNSR